MDATNTTLEDYILRHIDPEPDYLYRLWRATNLHLLNGRMASGHLQGRLLKMLVEMVRPQRVLEVEMIFEVAILFLRFPKSFS